MFLQHNQPNHSSNMKLETVLEKVRNVIRLRHLSLSTDAEAMSVASPLDAQPSNIVAMPAAFADQRKAVNQ